VVKQALFTSLYLFSTDDQLAETSWSFFQKTQLSFAVFFSSCYKEIVGSIYSLLYKSILILDSRRKTAVYLSGKIMNSSASGQLTSFML